MAQVRHTFENMQDFVADAEAAIDSMTDNYRDRFFELAQTGILRLVEITDDARAVVTGAYRVSHHIEDLGGQVLFSAPERPDPDEEFPDRRLRFDRPPIEDVVRQLSDNWTFGESIEFVNGRFYDESVEARHQIYRKANDSVEDAAEFIATRE